MSATSSTVEQGASYKRKTQEMDISKVMQKQSAQAKVAKMTVAHAVLLPQEVDTQVIDFVNRTGRDGQKKVFVNYGTRKLMVQTPWMTSFRGIEDANANSTYGETNGHPKYIIRCGLHDYDKPESESAHFVDMVRRMEEKVTEGAIVNSFEWFKKRNLTKTIITEAMLQRMLKFSTDPQTGEPNGRWPPEFKMKVQCYDGEWKCVAYDGTNESAPVKVEDNLADVVKGRMEVKAIIECSQVWVLNGKLGFTWNVKQLMYRPVASGGGLSPTAYAFDTPRIPTSFDVQTIQVGDLKVVNEDTGFKRAYLNDANGGMLYIQTPWLKSPGGIREPLEEYAQPGKTKFNISFVLDGFRGDNPETAAFYEQLVVLDEHLMNVCVKHSSTWFGKNKKLTFEVFKEAMYNQSVRVTTKDSGEESVWFKVNVPHYDGEWKCGAYPKTDDASARECQTEELDTLVNGKVMTRAILQCKGLYYTGGRVGCNWKVVQLEYEGQSEELSSGFAFRDMQIDSTTEDIELNASTSHDDDYIDSEEDA